MLRPSRIARLSRMAHPLDGVQAKIDRSFEHLETLVREVEIFIEGHPYDSIPGPVDAEGWKIARFHIIREPPPRLGIIAGDYAHNLRSALDHLVYQLAKLTTESPRGTQFPIAVDERDYLAPRGKGGPSMRDRYLACLRPEHRTMIDEVQPYRAGTRPKADDMALAHLNRFANTDKHRTIHAVYGRLQNVTAEPKGGTVTIELVPPDPMPILLEDTEVYRLRLSSPSNPNMGVNVTIHFTLAFGEYMLADGHLRAIHRDVVSIIDRFRPIFD